MCSPSTSEIGSVFGLRFDPQENKMTLQLTAAPAPAVCGGAPAGGGPMAAGAAGTAAAGATVNATGESAMDAAGNFASQLPTSPMSCR